MIKNTQVDAAIKSFVQGRKIVPFPRNLMPLTSSYCQVTEQVSASIAARKYFSRFNNRRDLIVRAGSSLSSHVENPIEMWRENTK